MQICNSSPFGAPHGTMLISMVVCMLLGQSFASSRLRASQTVFAKDCDGTRPCEGQTAVKVVPPNPNAIPKAGELVNQVKDQLASDHKTLGKYAAALMEVQTSVDKTEQSMLGKVLDLQTARSFFGRHAEINTANEKLHDEVSTLNDQVEGLSKTLYKTQQQFLANGHKYRNGEGKLHAETVENSAMIQSMHAELSKEDEVEKALKQLTKIHDHLLSEAIEVEKAGEKSKAMLHKERVVNRQEVKKHKSLREQLIQMNNYSVACHASVEKKSKALELAMLKENKDNKAAAMTLKQKQKANIATEQRMLAESALLVSEVKRVENEETDGIERIKDLREDMATLEESIVKEIRDIEAQILAEKERVKTLSASLQENIQAIENDMARKAVVDQDVKDKTKQLHQDENPVNIATVEGQNDALHAELIQAFAMWKSVKDAEMKADLNLEQAKAEVDAAKNAVDLATQELTAANEQGERQLTEAVKVANANKAKAEALIQKAQDALMNKCKAKWDARSKVKFKKLKKCTAMKEELDLEKAKKLSLEQTIKARAAAQA